MKKIFLLAAFTVFSYAAFSQEVGIRFGDVVGNDVAVDAIMNPWDIAAVVPCVEEAGGTVTDMEGRREHIVWNASLLSTSSPELQQQVLRVLHGNQL